MLKIEVVLTNEECENLVPFLDHAVAEALRAMHKQQRKRYNPELTYAAFRKIAGPIERHLLNIQGQIRGRRQ